MQNERSPAGFAADIDAARDRLIGFVDGCTDADWRSAPIDGDPRSDIEAALAARAT